MAQSKNILKTKNIECQKDYFQLNDFNNRTKIKKLPKYTINQTEYQGNQLTTCQKSNQPNMG